MLLAINAKELEALSRKPGFFTHLFEIKTGATTIQALARDAQRHPISETLEHVNLSGLTPKPESVLPCRSSSSIRTRPPASSAAVC